MAVTRIQCAWQRSKGDCAIPSRRARPDGLRSVRQCDEYCAIRQGTDTTGRDSRLGGICINVESCRHSARPLPVFKEFGRLSSMTLSPSSLLPTGKLRLRIGALLVAMATAVACLSPAQSTAVPPRANGGLDHPGVRLAALGVAASSLEVSGATPQQCHDLLAALPALVLPDWTGIDAQKRVGFEGASWSVDAKQIAFRGLAAKVHRTQVKSQRRRDMIEALKRTMPEVVVTRMRSAIRAQHRNVPAELRVASLSDRDWHQLEAAVLARRRVDRNGGVISDAHVNILEHARSDQAVVAARTESQQNAMGIRELFVVR